MQIKLQKVTLIEKTPEPFRVTDKKYDRAGKFLGFLGFFTKPAQPDFKGTVAGGRSVCFEAKATMEDCIEAKAVTEEQRGPREALGTGRYRFCQRVTGPYAVLPCPLGDMAEYDISRANKGRR